MSGRLVVMGSGETAPTMVEVHRAALRRAGDGAALLLDTPYGFQENADDITARACDYFTRNVGRRVTPLPWPHRLLGAELDRALAAVRTAAWLFAGPGSPTYALRVWDGSGLAQELAALVRRGGTVTFASAAALTLGVCAVPVYEIYKSGADPHWVPAMDVLRELTGLHAVLIPHYDNTEGGTHSTRFCYLGERRLRLMEPELPADAHVIGVDEHTALVLDLATGTASVLGNGAVTVRRDGVSRRVPTGAVVPIEDLAAEAGGEPSAPVPMPVRPPTPQTSLATAADGAREAFDAALAQRDADTAAAAVLDLEQTLHDWSSDTLQSSDTGHARRTLRGMVVELGNAAQDGLTDPSDRIAPLVDALLEWRDAAREARNFAVADALRARLAEAGVTVQDTPDGPQWALG